MNIKKAKEQIKNAIVAYFSKDERGNYIIPTQMQRPIFLMGPPGIGKTAIMKQIAEELDVGLLSYSMTHHTRQSILGLPFIDKKEFDGKEYTVSEYTMSEIIASVYEKMEQSGKKEGILFIDEINCVSETLAPIMLQFLQYKVFGKHKVPDGWIVVTAGNPPEYNNSVREFDVVTWDRLKRVDVEPDLTVWREYAYQYNVHPAVMSYLGIKAENFYNIKSSVDGKLFVTARGWDDLSQMLYLYEKNGLVVDENLVIQYLQHKNIAIDFAVYYDLFNKYKSDYQIDAILKGKPGDSVKLRAKNAKFDERYSLIGLIIAALTERAKEVISDNDCVTRIFNDLRQFRMELTMRKNPVQILDSIQKNHTVAMEKGKVAGSLSKLEESITLKLCDHLELIKAQLKDVSDSTQAFNIAKEYFDSLVKDVKSLGTKTGKEFSNAFNFLGEVFKSQEMSIFVVELTANLYTSKFIGKFGCKEYLLYNKSLLVGERQKEIELEIDLLKFDD